MSRSFLCTRIIVMFLIVFLIVPSGGLFKWPIMSARADPPEMFKNESAPENFSQYASNEPILIWDNDNGDKPDGINGSEHFINESLTALGYLNVTITQESENLTNYNLSNYTVIFALFGQAPRTGNITAGEEAVLTNYLDNEGRLYVEGGDVGFHASDNNGSGEFVNLWPYLKVNYISNGGKHDHLNGTANFLTGDMNFSYTGNNSSIDIISPAAGAFSMFNDSNDVLGVGYNGSYRTVFFSFEFGGLNSSEAPSTRDYLMKRIIHFFSYVVIRDISVKGENLVSVVINGFEGADDEGWTHSPVQGNIDVWQRGTPTSGPNKAHTGSNVWATNLGGNYPDQADFALYMPATKIGNKTELVFWHWYSIERGWDVATVEIFDNAQNQWRRLANYDGQSGGWVEESIVIPANFAGEVRIRFRFDTDINVNFPGWYIDDVKVLPSSELFSHNNGYIGLNEREIELNTTLENTGNTLVSFDLTARVYFQSNQSEVYNQTITVNLTAGELRNVGFPDPWNTSTIKNVTYEIEFRSFAREENGSSEDNSTSFWIYIGSYIDLYSQRLILDSTEPLLPGDVITVKGNFVTLSNVNISNFKASLKITDHQTNLQYWENISKLNINTSWGNNTTVLFPAWTVPMGDGNYLFNLTHNLSDMDDSNNVYERWIDGEEYYDMAPTEFHFNVSEPLNNSALVTINVSVTNWGNLNATNVSLRCIVLNRSGTEVYNQTNNTVSIALPTGNNSRIEFTDVTLPPEEGNITVIFDILWNDDENSTNDRYSRKAAIDDHHDMGLTTSTSISVVGDLTYGYYQRGVHQVNVNITNYGNVNQTATLENTYQKADTLFYDNVEGQSSWQNLGLQGQAQFHIVQPNSPHSDYHSSSHSWWFGDENTGNYADGSVNVLVTKVNLTNLSTALLKFWQKYDIANDGRDFSCVVYNETMVNNPQQATYYILGDTITGSSQGWIESTYDLTDFCGREILIGFGIVTAVGGNPTVDKGWYVDDIGISTPNASSADTHVIACPEVAPGEEAVVTDSYDFKDNETYYVSSRTLLDGDENGANDLGQQRLLVKDFPDLAVLNIEMTNSRRTDLFLDFENDDGGFLATGQNSFEWGSPTVPGGPTLKNPNTKCWAIDITEEYANNQDIALTGKLDLKNFTGAMLSFEHWYVLDSFNDGVWLELRNGSDGDFQNITPVGGYPSSCNIPPGWPGAPGQIPCYSESSQGWVSANFNLSDHVGYEVEIRFRFISDVAVIRPGWFMDNMRVNDPIKNINFKVNSNVNCVFSFDQYNFGNILSIGGTAELLIEGLTDETYSFSDDIVLTNLAPGDQSSKTFPTQWTSPEKEGLYLVTVALQTPNDIDEANSNLTIIVEVIDTHNIKPFGIRNPVSLNAYEMEGDLRIQGYIRNNGTHDETGITVNVVITEVGNDDWVPVEFTTIIDLKLKITSIVEFLWTVPSKLGAEYRVTFTTSHPYDEIAWDNSFNITFYSLPDDMQTGAFGFVKDDSLDSPYFGQNLANVTVQIKVLGSYNALATTTTNDTGFYKFDLSDIQVFLPGLGYTIHFTKDWYYLSTYDISLQLEKVYKKNIGMTVNNLNPRAVLSLPMIEPYYILADDEHIFSFSDSMDADDPDQKLTYLLESSISGVLYQGANSSANCVLEPGIHIINLTVTDEMGGTDSSSIRVESFNASWKSIEFQGGLLKLDLYSAGPGTVIISSARTVDIPEDLLDIGYSFNMQTEGIIFVLSAVVTFQYDEADLINNIREENLRIYKYDHEFPKAAWELVIPYEVDEVNNTVSVTLTGKNRTLDIDLIPLAVKDETAPYVVKTVPRDGKWGISVYTDIFINFSENIIFSQLDKEELTLEGDKELVEIELIYNRSTYSLQIVPVSDRLASNTEYVISIPIVYDLVYNRLDAFKITFRTEEWIQTKERISGFIRKIDSSPIPGANVSVGGATLATSDENGFYSFFIEKGIYTIFVNKTGYADIILEGIIVKVNQPVSKSFTMKPWVFLETTVVMGYVKDDASNNMMDALIKCNGKVKTRTDMNGFFTFILGNGTFDLAITKEDFLSYETTIRFTNEPIDLGTIILRRLTFAIVAGRIMDQNGKGIEGVKVDFKKSGTNAEYTMTDTNGSFYIELVEGNYAVQFTKVGYLDASHKTLILKIGDEEYINKYMENVETLPEESKSGIYTSWLILIGVSLIILTLIIFVIRRPVKDPYEPHEQTEYSEIEYDPTVKVESHEVRKDDDGMDGIKTISMDLPPLEMGIGTERGPPGPPSSTHRGPPGPPTSAHRGPPGPPPSTGSQEPQPTHLSEGGKDNTALETGTKELLALPPVEEVTPDTAQEDLSEEKTEETDISSEETQPKEELPPVKSETKIEEVPTDAVKVAAHKPRKVVRRKVVRKPVK